ncbi:hypothetical protein DH2020_021908 [Rehmannia glutinosa]|uniref:Mitochondrial carrier protein n=1 Tax=Rehmannia glutinosa TaxID=99300 RepID=A0ABR0WBT6_REHGL
MAGAGGGIVAQIITYPLQTVKFIDPRHGNFYFWSISSMARSTDCSRQVCKSEGLGGLYSGVKPSLLGTAASQAFKNKAEAIAVANKRKGKGDGSPGMLSWLIVATLAGSVNVLLTNPIWVLVTRMQALNFDLLDRGLNGHVIWNPRFWENIFGIVSVQ